MYKLFLFLTLLSKAIAGPVLSFNPAGASSGNENDQTVGWMFDVLSPITVNGLGWYAPNGAGLAMSHMVGIWDSGGDLIASAMVGSGTVDPLDGLFRTISISPVVLSAATGYIVGGQNFIDNTDQLAFGPAPTTIASVVFAGGVFSDIDGIFELPSFSTGNPNCCWGPSFSVSPGAAVPEPNTAALLGAAAFVAVALQAMRRRLRA